MHADTAAIARRSDTGSLPKAAGSVRLLTLDHLDKRTRAAKRARELANAFKLDLGGSLSVAQMAAVQRAAALVALAEDTRTRRLAGDLLISLEDLVRVDHAADLAVRGLGIRPHQGQRHVPLREALMAEMARNGPETAAGTSAVREQHNQQPGHNKCPGEFPKAPETAACAEGGQ